MATVELKPVSDLFGLTFWVPSYQRGYRWTQTQVEELLADLYAFASKRQSEDDYYCLQPVIVKKRDDCWELVDGQQRLTALWLISAFYYCSNREDVDIDRDQYTMIYQEKEAFTHTFEEINEFVKDGSMIQAKEQLDPLKALCIDSKFLIESIKYITEFTRNDGKIKAKRVLTDIFDAFDKIKVIWYVLDETEDPIETFTNINANKIELTNAELIKAVLLHSTDKENLVHNMALQWEEMEKKLNDEQFWSFITNATKKKYTTRIDYLFEIWCAKHEIAITRGSGDKHQMFREIGSRISSPTDAECFWREVREIFETLSDWHDTYYYYHTIGLLIILGEGSSDASVISNLYNKYSSVNKTDFRAYLISKIKKHFFSPQGHTPFTLFNVEDINNDLNEIAFGDGDAVKNTLLLYNIAMLVNANNTYEWFPFDLYKNEIWDIEHINPQTPKEASDDEKKAWLSAYRELLQSDSNATDLLEAIQSCLDNDLENFDGVSAKVAEHLEMPDNNSITNLVLLDASTNRGYKNNCFAEKRRKIIDVERNKNNDEKYIPIGTKWVFLKGFERANQLMVWSATDMNDYANDITENIYKMLAGDAE